jgi:hypothetical protein
VSLQGAICLQHPSWLEHSNWVGYCAQYVGDLIW